ncbi:DUF11 domain-containing protein [Empedobacter tilapiae]|uniref:DUF11 domain-containing protein n=1 Tax=Empedobacter tilapiae TaxID=2491114 RepID=A0A4Z1BUS7_9FLAO|nr:DUF11 domain-containing protein [Empedobacter tilapiae]TGN24231.1 DUF11 domain-containing protein [Empedobacter tilapiae]
MKKHLVILMSLFSSIFLFSQQDIRKRSIKKTLQCNPSIFLSQTNQLKLVDTSTNPFTYNNIGLANSFNYNAMGYNPVDSFLYAIKVSNSNEIVKINPTNGIVTPIGNINKLPVATYINGEIDDVGNFYVMDNTFTDALYKVNLTTLTSTKITLSRKIYSADFAFNPINGLLYGVNSASDTNSPGDYGKLYTINPQTGIVNFIGSSYAGNQVYGAMMGVVTGELYGSENSGNFYQFNILTGERTLISGAPPSSGNDGAHCVLSSFTLGIDLYITKTDNKTQYIPGTSNTYTIVAGNNGPYGTLGATVSDPLPLNIPSSNMSYRVTSLSGGATSNVIGTQIGAINDKVNLPVGAKVTYEVIINVPYTYVGDLTNKATINAPVNSSNDINLANNTASDTDTTTICYKPGNFNMNGTPTRVGITNLQKQVGWPENIPNGFIALESKSTGLVITRVQNNTMITEPKEGMIIYDINANCVSLYNGSIWKCIKQDCNN